MSQSKVDYSKGIIYKLCCKDPEITDIYIGSTTNLIKRKNCHKTSCTNPNSKSYDYNVYQFIRTNGEWLNWDMIEIEMYNATSKRDLIMRERYWVDTLKPTLNKNIPTRTDKEYYVDNIEVIAQKKKEYREANKEVISQKNKEYREKNREVIAQKQKEKIVCECGTEIVKYTLSKHKKTQKHIKLLEKKQNK
jgi:hypothetical protein